MPQVVLFHHAQGLTSGVVSFIDVLRAAGHVVHTPDLYDGATFDDLDAGVPLQIHGRGRELFRYPGDAHLFTDDSLPAHDANAAALVRERVLGFLGPTA